MTQQLSGKVKETATSAPPFLYHFYVLQRGRGRENGKCPVLAFLCWPPPPPSPHEYIFPNARAPTRRLPFPGHLTSLA